MIPVWQHCAFAHWFLFYIYFPTCQGRVVRFYVSLFSSSSFSFFSSASSSVSLSCCDSVCSVWHVGPQLRSCEFSVACWTSTAILWVQCGVPDPNRDPACSVWRAGSQLWSRVFSAVCRTSTAILRVHSVWRTGPQPRSCVFSVACRTPTVISCVQCCVPDLNCDSASSVWHTGPQPRLCEFSVACRTAPVMERIGSSCKMSQDKSDRMSGDMFARRSERMCQRDGWFASCWWLGGWWLVARHICDADACPQTGKSHSTGHDWPSGGSFTQRATCLSSRIDWQVGSQRCCHAGALAELACVWILENLLTSHSAFGFNRLSAERSVGIRDASNSLEVYWHVWCLVFILLICLTGSILTCFGMFEHAPLLSL